MRAEQICSEFVHVVLENKVAARVILFTSSHLGTDFFVGRSWRI